MGLFHRNSIEDPELVGTTTTANGVPPRRTSTLFSRRRSTSPVGTTTTAGSNSSRRLRHRHDDGAAAGAVGAGTVAADGRSPHRGFLHRNQQDPSIIAAKERVSRAEVAEREADKALNHARASVREAREVIKRLEREAAEE